LGGGGKWRSESDERKPDGKSNSVGLHGRDPYLRFARVAARPIGAQARGKNLIWSRHYLIRLFVSPAARRVAPGLNHGQAISADRPEKTLGRSPSIFG
jgi:hypothetical protein